MSFDRATRNLLADAVGTIRERLKADVMDELRRLGFQNDGTVLDLVAIGGLTEGERASAQELRALLAHLTAAERGADGAGARGRSEREVAQAAYDRMAREIGFTTLNRLVALRMAEARGLIVQSVSAGLASSGFQIYEGVAGSALGSRHQTYRAYLECLYDEIARDLPALFDRTDPHSRIFPGERCLEDVLARLNVSELASLWAEDETIGWVYQYYNDADERKKMRESQAPRTSRELAVRNQFFTPRYVVEFLTDNTLGRTWYEMRQGETRLVDECRYMVRRKHTVFLANGELAPEPYDLDADMLARRDPGHLGEMWMRSNPALLEMDDSGQQLRALWAYALTFNGYVYAQEVLGNLNTAYCGDLANERVEEYSQTGAWRGTFEELRLCLFHEQRRWRHDQDLETEFIPYRAPRDPRTITVLDPAVGSAHFLLYAFDLLVTIYEEAEPDLPREQIPALILRHNLHGIDIDPRAVQIGSLALYFKARKYDRDARVETMNIVCAAPMPGERHLFTHFLAELNSPTLARIAEAMWDELALAGVAGSLLKPEVKLRQVVAQQRQQEKKQNAVRQQALLPELERPTPEALDFSDVTDERFWTQAEESILTILRDYTEQASNAEATARRLFASDSTQGFRFVDLLRSHYDVVLMNPPFGEGVATTRDLMAPTYPRSKNDLYAAFVERGLEVVRHAGILGAITSRTGFFQTSFKEWRRGVLLAYSHIDALADLGFGVLDKAMVETAAYILRRDSRHEYPADPSVFARLLDSDPKDSTLRHTLAALRSATPDSHLHFVHQETFRLLPDAPFPYWVSNAMRELFQRYSALQGNGAEVQHGLSTKNDPRFLRLCWEVSAQPFGRPHDWATFAKGGEYSPYYSDVHLVVRHAVNFAELEQELLRKYPYLGESGVGWVLHPENYYFRPGLTYPRVTFNFTMRAMPAECIFADKGPAVFAESAALPYLLGLFNSRLFIFVLHMVCEIRRWEVGRVQSFPYIVPSQEISHLVGDSALRCHDYKRIEDRSDEPSHVYTAPALLLQPGVTLAERMQVTLIWLSKNIASIAVYSCAIDQQVLELYGISALDRAVIEHELGAHPGSYPDDTARLDEARFRQAYLTKEEVADEEVDGDTEPAVSDEEKKPRRARMRYRNWEALAHLFRVHPDAIARRRVTTQLTSCTWHLTDHNILCFSRCNCLVLAVLMPRIRRGEHKMLRSSQPKS